MVGFGSSHFTHLYCSRQGNTYNFCYDYTYMLPDDKVLIVNWQPYMEKG